MTRVIRLALAAALLCVSTPALAQATRTWVSGVGDDANPCSRTAPCKTFQGAITKTATGGEIDALDPGGFGALTITKSITLDGRAGGGILAAGGAHGVIINAPGATVTLRNVTIAGAGTGGDGVRVVAAARVRLESATVSRFAGDGIRFTPAAGGELLLRGVSLTDNAGAGVRVGAGAGNTSTALLERTSLRRGAQGLALEAGGRATAYDVTATGNAGAGLGVRAGGSGERAELNVERAQLSHNGAALQAAAVGGGSALVRLSRATASSGVTTRLVGEGSVLSYGNNRLLGGSTPACTAGAVTLEQDALTPGTLESAYGPVELALLDGLGQARWTLTGALPRGLQFDAGVLSGTPTEGGSFPLGVSATDGNGCTATRSYTLVVPCPATSLDPASVPDGTTGQPYPATAFTHAGAAAPSTLTVVGTLPIGLTLTDGTLAGRPTQPGTFLFDVSATDVHRCGASRGYTLTVARSADFQDTSGELSSSANPAPYGSPLTFRFALSGGTGGEPTGTVAFFNGDALLSEVPLSARAAVLSAPRLAAGSYSVRAVYSGDERFGGAAAGPLAVQITPVSTQSQLTSAGAVRPGEPLSLRASVTSAPDVPTGSVTFREGDQVLGSAALDAAGLATLQLAAGLPTGTHALVAAYAGNANHLASTSSPLQQEVLADGAPAADQGCGCGQAGAPGLSAPLLLLLALAARRRGRRAAGGAVQAG